MKFSANERGQMTIEMILMSTILFAVILAVSQYFKSNHILAGIVEGPQTYLIGMAENGVWKQAKDANQFHPNLVARHMSYDGEH